MIEVKVVLTMVTTNSIDEIRSLSTQLIQKVNEVATQRDKDEEDYLNLRWETCDVLLQALRPQLKYIDRPIKSMDGTPRGVGLPIGVIVIRGGGIYLINKSSYQNFQAARSAMVAYESDGRDLTEFEIEEMITHSILVSLRGEFERALGKMKEREEQMESGMAKIDQVLEALKAKG